MVAYFCSMCVCARARVCACVTVLHCSGAKVLENRITADEERIKVLEKELEMTIVFGEEADRKYEEVSSVNIYTQMVICHFAPFISDHSYRYKLTNRNLNLHKRRCTSPCIVSYVNIFLLCCPGWTSQQYILCAIVTFAKLLSQCTVQHVFRYINLSYFHAFHIFLKVQIRPTNCTCRTSLQVNRCSLTMRK